MCGIFGLVCHPDYDEPFELESALEKVKMRGRDRWSVIRYPQIILGCARFAVIDPTGSPQPLSDSCTQRVLVGNGEIFNFRELRKLPHIRDYPFSTNGDLEVIFPLLTHYGIDGLDRIRGPFAFALWDDSERSLILARDRFGERPLYYCSPLNHFFFSSSIESCARLISAPLEDENVRDWLTLGWIPYGTTLAKNVSALAPGSCLTFRKSEIQTRHFFARSSLACIEDSCIPVDVEGHLERALDRVFTSDAPIGVALSGGIDSATLLAHAAQLGRTVQCFSVVAPDDIPDENRERARACAAFFKLPLNEIPFYWPVFSDLIDLLKSRVDNPAAEPMIVHNDLLHRCAGIAVKVLIGGHGADEVFAGYSRYATALNFFRNSTLPNIDLFRAFVHCPGWRRMNELASSSGFLNQVMSPKYYRPGCLSYALSVELNRRAGPDPLKFAQALDFQVLHGYLQFQLPDENGMSNQVEVRSPYYDWDLVEALFRTSEWRDPTTAFSKLKLRERLQLKGLNLPFMFAPKVGFDDAFDYQGWIADQLPQFIEVIRGGSLCRSGLIVPAALDRLNPKEARASGLVTVIWRMFALSLWLDKLRA